MLRARTGRWGGSAAFGLSPKSDDIPDCPGIIIPGTTIQTCNGAHEDVSSVWMCQIRAAALRGGRARHDVINPNNVERHWQDRLLFQDQVLILAVLLQRVPQKQPF